MKEREKMSMNKPKNVLDGIGGGAKSLATGVFKGVVGKNFKNYLLNFF